MKTPLLRPTTLVHTTTVMFTRSPLVVYKTLLAVDQYPTFMPWCKKADIAEKSSEGWTVDLTIGFNPVLLHCRSFVKMQSPSFVGSVFTKNKLFEMFELEWRLQPGSDALAHASGVVPIHTCEAKYTIKFKFASPAFHNLTKLVLNTVCTETAKAFAKKVEDTTDKSPVLYDATLKEFVIAK